MALICGMPLNKTKAPSRKTFPRRCESIAMLAGEVEHKESGKHLNPWGLKLAPVLREIRLFPRGGHNNQPVPQGLIRITMNC
jgi:hypothetical protein